MKLTYQVKENEAGRTVNSILRHKIGLSSKMIRKLKKHNGIALNGSFAYVKEKVKADDVLTLTWQEDKPNTIEPQNIPLQIIFEDEHLLVVNKPAGMLVHPLKHEPLGTLANAVSYYFRQNNLSIPFRPVYRLDRDTSGPVVVAKHAVADSKLSRQLHSTAFCRQYLAVVHGIINQLQAVIALPIGRSPDGTLKYIVDAKGKRAVTFYKVERHLKNSTLVKLVLQTGRTHQIRVHMQHIGFPLVGDKLYGGLPQGINRQALHCHRIELIHPVTEEKLCWEVPPPDDIRKLIYDII